MSRSSLKASYALYHSSLPNNLLYNHCSMFRFNLMGPNRSPLFGLLYTLLTTKLLGSSAIALCGFGC
jgi:hypothetical protein